MQLVEEKKKCCGCGACVNVCPKSAITMQKDSYGFVYPQIDMEKCVRCGLCESVCDFKKSDYVEYKDKKIFAVVNKDLDLLYSSTSGGAFAALAKWIIDKQGIVYGCAWDANMFPVHLAIESMSEISRLQGSKYVQSDTKLVYQDVKKSLLKDRYVLFSGTPCQCAGLRAYLGRNYDKLYCVELICHGVPSDEMFHEYVELLEKKVKGKIQDIHFRDKKLGWGALLRIDYVTKRNRRSVKYMKPEESYYYYYYFYKGLFFRDSCYACKYAKENRESDFTIGDYWGGQKKHRSFHAETGISVLIATGKKAISVMSELCEYLEMEETKLQDVKVENGQIVQSSSKNQEYESLMEKYHVLGCDEFEKWFNKTHRKLILKGKIKRYIPMGLKRQVKKIMGI